MAANTHISQAAWDAALDAALDAENSGFLDIYDSTGTGQPATPDVAVTTQVKLATLALSATAYGAAVAGVKTANAITSGVGLAAGAATWGRFYKSDHSTAVHDASVGSAATDPAADIQLNDTSITVGGTVSLTGYTCSMPVAQ